MGEVWIVNHYAISPDQSGGTRHYDFGTELVKAGLGVRIFAACVGPHTRKPSREPRGQLWIDEDIGGVQFSWVRTTTYKRNDWRRVMNMFQFGWNVYRVGMKQGTRPGVIVGSSPHLVAALAAERLARKLGCRFVLEIRDLWPQALVDMVGVPESHPVVRILRRIEQHLYRRANHIIVLAEGAISYLVERGVSRERISFIPNGVHPDHFVPRLSREEARGVYGFEKYTVIYTGAHGPANALHVIIEAADLLRDETGIEFVLVGDGPCKIELQHRAQQLKLPNLRFMNPVSKIEVPDLLAAADAAVITLKNIRLFTYGVSPNKLFDYMAAGKPVICAVPGDMARMVDDSACGVVVPPENGAALAEKVRMLTSLPEDKRKEMGLRGQTLVFERYSRRELARQLINILR